MKTREWGQKSPVKMLGGYGHTLWGWSVSLWLLVVVFALMLIPGWTFAEADPDCSESTTVSKSVSCPTITSNGAIDKNYFCVNQGQSPPMPQLTNQPAQSSGKVVVTFTTTASDCSVSIRSFTNTVSYGFSGLKYNPAPPTSSSAPGVYKSDCFVSVTSSDTNNCPSPGNINYGKITWNVMSTNCVVIQEYFSDTNGWVINEVGFAGEPAGGGGFHQYDGYTVKFTANVTAICQIGCSTFTNSGVKFAEFEHTGPFDTVEVYTIGSPGINVALPTSLPGAVGELIGSVLGDQIAFYGVAGDTLSQIAAKILADKSTLTGPSAGSWENNKPPCCP